MNGKLSRRTFLKVAGATTAAVMALSGTQKQAISQINQPYTESGIAPIPDTVEVTGCMYCQNGCSMKVHLKNGRIVNIDGNPDDPVTNGRLCPKGQNNLNKIYNKYRLKNPLKRVGPRGSAGSYQEISWEQAFKEIAEKLHELRNTYGGEALAMFVAGRSEGQARSAFGGPFGNLFGVANREGTGPLCNYAGQPAGSSVIGHRNPPWTYTREDFGGADWYMFVGSNMAANKPVSFGMMNDERIKRGAKLIVVDPRMSETASKADVWLPIRPSTDLGLALGMMYHIVAKNLQDQKFINEKVIGFDKLKDFLLQKRYTPDWAETVTGIPAQTIKELAEEYARTEKAIIVGNTGVSHHTNAVQTHRAFYMLAAITGHFGKPSMGYASMNNGATNSGGIPVPSEMVPKREKLGIRKSPVGWYDAMTKGKPYPLKGLISFGHPFTQWPNQAAIKEAVSSLDISIFFGLFPSEETVMFDYILPASPWVESGGLAPVSDERRLVWVPKLVPEVGNAKPERWIWIELGKAMGWGEVFKDEYKDPVALQRVMSRNTGFSPERFMAKKDRALRGPMFSPDAPEGGTLYLNGTSFPGQDGKQFPTKSGKIEIWTEEVEKNFNVYGLGSLPEFYADPEIGQLEGIPYLEYLDTDSDLGVRSPYQGNRIYAPRVKIVSTGKKNTQYDMVLTSGRPSAAHFGNGTHWIWMLHEQSSEQDCWIHPEKAAELSLKAGDEVKVESAREWFTAKVNINSGIRKDTVFVPGTFAGDQPWNDRRSVNYAVDHAERCPVSAQTNYKALTVKLVKA
jgi:anaerobic selenocysteine-containing dehydrogenase